VSMLTIRDIPLDATDGDNPDRAVERIADWLDAQRLGARLDFRGVEHTHVGDHFWAVAPHGLLEDVEVLAGLIVEAFPW